MPRVSGLSGEMESWWNSLTSLLAQPQGEIRILKLRCILCLDMILVGNSKWIFFLLDLADFYYHPQCSGVRCHESWVMIDVCFTDWWPWDVMFVLLICCRNFSTSLRWSRTEKFLVENSVLIFYRSCWLLIELLVILWYFI